MNKIYTIKGQNAIRLAARDGLTLQKYADPIDGERAVTVDEALRIAQEDSGLIYVKVTPNGWFGGNSDGYHVEDYFNRDRYLGPDCDGVEPTWVDAE